MEKTATLNLRVNPTVKERAEKVLTVGFTLKFNVAVFSMITRCV